MSLKDVFSDDDLSKTLGQIGGVVGDVRGVVEAMFGVQGPRVPAPVKTAANDPAGEIGTGAELPGAVTTWSPTHTVLAGVAGVALFFWFMKS